jgi:DeoR family transcriptional regulator, fructose operon transcriptional repressor
MKAFDYTRISEDDSMLKTQRLEIIMDLVKNKKIVSIEQLVSNLGISESTVRRDIETLDKQGLLKRIHGGVQYINKIKSELVMNEKLETNNEQKEKIAKYAASLVEDRDCIFLDAGSTTLHMIPHLKDKNITVITNGINHIEQLITHNINSYIVCGQIKPTTKAILGEETIDYLKKYYFDKAFLGINGISFENAFSTPDIKEASVKQLVIRHSKRSYIVADASKFNQSCLVRIAELDEATVITDYMNDEYQEHVAMEVVGS